MSDKTPAVDPLVVAQANLEAGIRHLYSAALTMARLTGGQSHDAPRLLVAAAAHGVTFLIERINGVQAALESSKTDTREGAEATREVLRAQLDKMATDLSRTMQEFDIALNEGLTSLRQMREAEDEPDDPPAVTH